MTPASLEAPPLSASLSPIELLPTDKETLVHQKINPHHSTDANCTQRQHESTTKSDISKACDAARVTFGPILTKIHYRAALTCPKKLWWTLSEFSGNQRMGLGVDGTDYFNASEQFLNQLNKDCPRERDHNTTSDSASMGSKIAKENTCFSPSDMGELFADPENISGSDGALLTLWPDLLKKLPNTIPPELKVRWGDAGAFGALAREFESKQLSKRGEVQFIRPGNFEQAIEQTNDALQRHFGDKSPAEIAVLPPFALQSPAFEAVINVPVSSASGEIAAAKTITIKVRARPGLLRWTPRKASLLMQVPGLTSQTIDAEIEERIRKMYTQNETMQAKTNNDLLTVASHVGHWQVLEHRASLNLTTAGARTLEHDFEWTSFVLKQAKDIDIDSCGLVKLNRAHWRAAYDIVRPNSIPMFQLQSLLTFQNLPVPRYAARYISKADKGRNADEKNMQEPYVQHVSNTLGQICAMLTAGNTNGQIINVGKQNSNLHVANASDEIIIPSALDAAHFGRLSMAYKDLTHGTGVTQMNREQKGTDQNHDEEMVGETLLQKQAEFMALKTACEAQPSFVGPHCATSNCPYIKRCTPPKEVYPNSIFSIRLLQANTKRILWNRGLKRTAGDVPLEQLSEAQKRYVALVAKHNLKSHAAKQQFVSPGNEGVPGGHSENDCGHIRKTGVMKEGEDYEIIDHAAIHSFYKSLQYPIICLDFETTQWAIPAFAKAACYEQIPFQYSMHVWYQDFHGGTEEPEHYEFVHLGSEYDPTVDPRPAFILKFVEHFAKIEETFKRTQPVEAATRESKMLEDIATMNNSKGKRGKAKGKSSNDASPLLGTLLCHNASFEKGVVHKLKLYIDAIANEQSQSNTKKRYVQHTSKYESLFRRRLLANEISQRYFNVDQLQFKDTMDLAKHVVLRQAEGSLSIKTLMPVLTDKPALRNAYKEGSIGDGLAANSQYRLLASRWATVTNTVPDVVNDNIEYLLSSLSMHNWGNLNQAQSETVGVVSEMEKLKSEMLRYCGIDTLAVREVACGILRLVDADPSDVGCFTTMSKMLQPSETPVEETLDKLSKPRAPEKRTRKKRGMVTAPNAPALIAPKSAADTIGEKTLPSPSETQNMPFGDEMKKSKLKQKKEKRGEPTVVKSKLGTGKKKGRKTMTHHS